MIADLVVTKLEARRRRPLMLAEAARYLGRSKRWLRVETGSSGIGRVRKGRVGRVWRGRCWNEPHGNDDGGATGPALNSTTAAVVAAGRGNVRRPKRPVGYRATGFSRGLTNIGAPPRPLVAGGASASNWCGEAIGPAAPVIV